jgi:hypothetical protein
MLGIFHPPGKTHRILVRAIIDSGTWAKKMETSQGNLNNISVQNQREWEKYFFPIVSDFFDFHRLSYSPILIMPSSRSRKSIPK